MSVSVKSVEFPASCVNSACGKALYGPVKHCPFCGSRLAQVAALAAKAVIAPTIDLKPAAPAAKVAAPVAAKKTAAVVNFDLIEVEPLEPPAKPVPSPVVESPKPKGTLKKILMGLVVLAVVVSYGLYQLGSRHTREQFEQNLLAGQNCLKNNRFDCALENAELALQKDSKEPRAVSLLQRAQAGLERQQQNEEAQKAAAARQAANKKAQPEKAAQEQAARDQAAREKEQRDLDQRMQLQEQLRAQQQQQQQQQQPEIRTPTPRPSPPARPIQGISGANPGVVGQSLSQARSALARQDYQSAIAVANVVLTMDPGNRQARIIIRQAEQLRTQALNRTTIE
ncbi:hypothetical protein [Pseudomonas fluorescens]|uniref:Uncharacterized protein n=1 Tax=Pseudomonas fluorescens TaxID=294 RepID=A0A5E7DCV1_PSEFL|nr:hypothetical protein [Pseudomonas fluorescens]VVO15123.1 hypothetical protein PS723_03744 [Pseudomonas fluorescens]